MRAATLTSSLAQAPVKHILYSSTRDTLSIDPANTKYAISTLSFSETPGRKYTILALHGSEFCGKMGISFKNIQSHSLGVGKLEVTDETIRQPYSSCLPSARRSWDWIHLPRSWSWISRKKRFLNKKLLVKISPLTVLRLTSTRHRTYPAAFTSAIVGGKGEVMCIVVEGVEHADQLTLNLKTR